MNMLKRVRELMTLPEPEPSTLNPKFFIVPPALKIDPADMSGNIKQAIKELTAMTEQELPVTETFRQKLEEHRVAMEMLRDRIKGEQTEASAEHEAQVKRLNDEIKSRRDIFTELTADNDARIADVERTLSGITAALRDVDATGAGNTAPKAKHKPRLVPAGAPETDPEPAS